MSNLSRNPIRRAPGGIILPICLLLLVQLACISMEIGFKVIPEGPDSGKIEGTITYRLTDEYVQAARQANQDLNADYEAAGQTPPGILFPESLQDMEDKPDFSEMLETRPKTQLFPVSWCRIGSQMRQIADSG